MSYDWLFVSLEMHEFLIAKVARPTPDYREREREREMQTGRWV